MIQLQNSKRFLPRNGSARVRRNEIVGAAIDAMSPCSHSLIERLESRRLLASLPTPAGYWRFDEGQGTTSADASGNGRTATLSSGAQWVTGQIGPNAIKVSGTSTGRATVTGPVVDTAGSFTVSAWVKLDSLSGFQTFVSIAGTSVAGFFLQLRGDTGKFGFTRLGSDAGGTSTHSDASVAPMLGTWYHLVGVNDAAAGKLSLYVDGQLVDSDNFSSGWTASGDTLIGQGFYNGTHVDYVNGSIDEVAMYNVALTASEVSALDLGGHYLFNEGSGATAGDNSGHGNTLSLGAGAGWSSGRSGTTALDVNGSISGNAVVGSPLIDTSASYSVSTWVRLDALSGFQTFASIDGTNVSGFYLQLRDDHKFAFVRLGSDSPNATNYAAASTIIASPGAWYHLLGVNDIAAGTMSLYVNGLLQSTISAPTGWKANGATVIGGGKFNGGRVDFVNGQVDDVRFYNSALTNAAAIQTPFPIDLQGTQSAINILAQSPGITISPDFFGLFMEDINYGGEGGVYSDLIRNGGFNDSSSVLRAWQAVSGSTTVAALTSDATTGPTTALTMSGKLAVTSGVSASSRAGIANTGFFGVAVAPSTTYSFQFYAKASAGFTGPLTVSLESNSGTVYASATIPAITSSWAKYTGTFTTGAGAAVSSTNRVVISTNSASANGRSIWFGSVHVFPPSYKNSPANLRVDLMEKLAALKPAFFRVPGGNYLEGNTYADRFLWYNTIGPIENRPGHYNSAWGYWSSDGMGLDEYLQMAELIGARPILGVFAGYTLDGTSSTGAQLATDVQDAINELHYVLDPVTTSWGAMRAANGHPEPYDLREVEIGNEDWFSSTYPTRYPLFYNAIRAEFPQLKIIASHTATGGSPYDIIDEHFYVNVATNVARQDYYDNRSRSGADVFVGEWATREGSPTPHLSAGLADAVWLFGMMENSDLVTMQCYAPLWVNVNGMQWSSDLIGFNNTSSYGSPSYYVQEMLSNNHGQQTIWNSKADTSGQLRTMVSRTGDTYYLSVVNLGGATNTSSINLSGIGTVWPTAKITTLSGSSATATNSITNPAAIVPLTMSIGGVDNGFAYTFPAYSLTIVEFTANNAPLGDVPTVASPASASPAPVTGTTTTLSVLGADAGGEAGLTYEWQVIGTPPASVNFSVNDSNSAKSTIATFSASGTYQFQVTITNPGGRQAISSVSVTVTPAAAGFVLLPASATVQAGLMSQFTLATIDQFGQAINQPIAGLKWAVTSGPGSISASGLYTAGAAGGSATITASASAFGTRTATVSVVENVVAHYKADQTSGTTLTDSSGHGYTASLSGSYSFGTGFTGNALNLTGGYATLPAGIVSTLTDFTISTWVNLSSISNWSRIFDFGTGTSVNMFLTPSAGGTNALRFAITTNGNGAEQRVDGPALSTNNWTHIAIALADTTATLYVNGVAAGSNTNVTLDPRDLGLTSGNFIGDSQYSNDPALMGSIDDFRIYGSGLSAAEAAAIYNEWRKPTVATPAAASPSPVVNATSTNLSVLGASAAGESNLTYTWSVVGTPPAEVTFDVNGTNAARNSVARFTASGTYQLLVTIADTTGATVASMVDVSVTVPVATVVSSVHDWLTAQNTLNFTFSRDVGQQPWMSLITVAPGGGGAPVNPVSAIYDAGTRTVRYTLPAGLSDGDYRATLSKGTFLATDATLDFFSLAGDANRDRVVDITDLGILATNWQGTNKSFNEGDFNYDGTVDITDLGILATNWQKALPAPAGSLSGGQDSAGAITRRGQRRQLIPAIAPASVGSVRQTPFGRSPVVGSNALLISRERLGRSGTTIPADVLV